MSERRFERGFTLVEVLVTVLILGLLAAVVFPVVADRASDADPTVVANDLANLRTGTELFRLDVRPSLPGDVEDLVNLVSTTEAADSPLTGGAYSSGQNNNWEGPYVDIDVAEGTASGSSVRTTAFDGDIRNGFRRFDSENNLATSTNSDFLAIQVNGLATNEFNEVDALIDNEPSGGEASGKLRFVAGEMFFLAQPIK